MTTILACVTCRERFHSPLTVPKSRGKVVDINALSMVIPGSYDPPVLAPEEAQAINHECGKCSPRFTRVNWSALALTNTRRQEDRVSSTGYELEDLAEYWSSEDEGL